MKLRNFLYLNTKVIDDYISSLDGYTYDKESQEIAKSNEKTVDGKIGIKALSGNAGYAGRQEEKIERTVSINEAAKFDKIYKFLEADDEGLKYYESFDDSIYEGLRRDDFLEVLVSARFSKMKAITDSVMKIAQLATAVEAFTEQEVLNKEASKVIDGFTALNQLKSGKEIACVFEFEDNKFPMVAHLDESFFRCEQENFVGQAYLLCKIIRKIPKGQNIKLDEIFADLKKLPLNREQKRKMPKNMENPAELRDEIKGPALVVLPIAFYQ